MPDHSSGNTSRHASDDHPADADTATISWLAGELRRERRQERYWKYGFRAVLLTLALIMAWQLPGTDELPSFSGGHTALVRLEGPLIAGDVIDGVDAERVIASLRSAFDDDGTQAVVLLINSPGGSPAQADQIYDEIQWLRGQHPDTPIHAVISDLGVSAAYYVASACEQIHVNRSGLVGSIGVISGQFGMVSLLEKIGVERRLYTAGDYKGMLDPFLPQKPDEVAIWQGLLDTVHRQFIDRVKEGRGARLSDHPDLFTGMIWVGEQALPLGLVDTIGNLHSVAREVIQQPDIVDFTLQQTWYEKLGRNFVSETMQAALSWLSRPRLGGV